MTFRTKINDNEYCKDETAMIYFWSERKLKATGHLHIDKTGTIPIMSAFVRGLFLLDSSTSTGSRTGFS